MIRRNHIETITKVRRQSLGSNNRSHASATPYSESYQKKSEYDLGDENNENYRIPSNKQYHLYKDWKQHHHRNKKQQDAPLRQSVLTSLPLPNSSAQCISQKDEKLKLMDKDYNYKPLNLNASRYRVYSRQKDSHFDYLSQHNDQNHQQQKRQKLSINYNSQQNSLKDRTIDSYSPSFRQPKYQSTRKTVPYSQLECESLFPFSHPQPSQFAPNPTSSPPKTITSIYQKPEPQSFQVPQNKEEISDRIIGVQDMRRRKQRKEWECERRGGSMLQVGGSERVEVAERGQRVSARLKEISNFNEEINQRIKGIIDCFEALKRKY